MKSLYEKRARLGINTILFGYPKKSSRAFYFVILALIVVFSLIA